MKKLPCLFALLALCLPPARGAELSDTLSLKRVFADVQAKAFDLLGRGPRLDMMDYAEAGTDYSAVNEMYGHSTITAYSDSCISVDITAVSSAQVFTLPTRHGGVAAVIYTVDPGAADSQITFYDPQLKPIKAGKHFKAPRLRDFLAPGHRDDKQARATLEAAVPFTAMRYAYEPRAMRLRVTLSLHGLLSQEDLKRLAPLLPPQAGPCADPTLTYSWNGDRFQLINP